VPEGTQILDAPSDAMRTRMVGHVTSGYASPTLGSSAARAPGQTAGSHFFKASIWLWQVDAAPTYEALLRRSFMGYVWTLLQRTIEGCGLVTRRFV